MLELYEARKDRWSSSFEYYHSIIDGIMNRDENDDDNNFIDNIESVEKK